MRLGKKLMMLGLVVLAAMLAVGPAEAQNAKKAATVSALEAWQMMNEQPKTTFIIDVRTRAEYSLLGHPPAAYNIPWRMATNDFQVKDGPYGDGSATYTGYQLEPAPNPDFLGVAKSLFKPEDRLIIISTAGHQGAEAADALKDAGFKNVFNVQHGFLGDALNPTEQGKLAEKFSPHFGQRGRVNGWIYWGLPVNPQTNPRYVYPPDLKRMQSTE